MQQYAIHNTAIQKITFFDLGVYSFYKVLHKTLLFAFLFYLIERLAINNTLLSDVLYSLLTIN